MRNYYTNKSMNTYYLITCSATINLVLEFHIQRWTPSFLALRSSANQWINEYIVESLLDLSKAFRSVNHEQIKTKLNNSWFSESAIEMIPSFISKRQQLKLNRIEFHSIKWYFEVQLSDPWFSTYTWMIWKNI